MTEYLLKLTPADLGVIDRALQEIAHKFAAPLIAKINAQLQAQQERPKDEPG
jgi:hypothetical protein